MRVRTACRRPGRFGALLGIVALGAALACSGEDGSGGDGDDSSDTTGGNSNGSGSGGAGNSGSGGGGDTGGSSDGNTGGSTGTAFPHILDVFDAEVGVLFLGPGPFTSVLSEFSDSSGTQYTVGALTATDSAAGVEIFFSESGEMARTPQYLSEVGLGGGETLAISTTGGSVAPFATALSIPLAPLITSHTGTPGADGVVIITASRNADLVVTWDARGAADAVWANTLENLTHGWSFDAASGTGTIPSSELQQIGVNERILFYAVNQTRVQTNQGSFDCWGQFDAQVGEPKATIVFSIP